jgi:hypothetical protein
MTCRICESLGKRTATLTLSGLSRQTGEAVIRMLDALLFVPGERSDYHRVTLHRDNTCTLVVQGRTACVRAFLGAAHNDEALPRLVFRFVLGEQKATREALP